MTDFEDRYYSMPEICKYVGISRDSALKWSQTKVCPPTRSARSGNSNFPKLMRG